jgi:uncharacterized SAM-binding protein YcdF (DUF218 family)
MISPETYDIAIVTGTGIKEDGSLPASAIANVRRAVDIYNSGSVEKIIFSGKWSWSVGYTPPVTEAKAMSQLALTLGIPESSIIIENESNTTVSNLCNIKSQKLIPNGWKNAIFIVAHPVLIPRFEYNVSHVLGPDYSYRIISSDLEYSPEILAKLTNSEPKKLEDTKKFYTDLPIGDHELISQKARKDLEDNYIKK